MTQFLTSFVTIVPELPAIHRKYTMASPGKGSPDISLDRIASFVSAPMVKSLPRLPSQFVPLHFSLQNSGYEK